MTTQILVGDKKRRKPGPPKGFKIDPAVLAKRKILRGADHYRWSGDAVSEKAGRKRALKAFREIGPCVECGAVRSERHHIDGNTSNNDATNIKVLCRRCHMIEDGRMETFKRIAAENLSKMSRRS